MITLSVVLQTQPAATSDPDSLTSLNLSRSTLSNTHDAGESQYNFFDIAGVDIIGDLPAFIRLMIRNSQSDVHEKMSRIYVTARSNYYSDLANLLQIYESDVASVVQYSQFWSIESDGSRSNDSYRLCTSSPSDMTHILRFPISNEIDHRGRVIILACIMASGNNYDQWRIKARYRAASDTIVESTPETQPNDVRKWHLVYCGELDLPPTPIDDSESISPSIDLVMERKAGDVTNAIAVDFIALIFLDESTIQFDIDAGFSNSEKLLSMRLPKGENIAHIVNQSTLAINRVVDKQYGADNLEISPGYDTRVMALFERIYITALIDEDFESYEDLCWLAVDHFEDYTEWSGAVGEDDSVHKVEGDYAFGFTLSLNPGRAWWDAPDFTQESRFTSADFACIMLYIDDKADLSWFRISFRKFFGSNDYFYKTWLAAAYSNGYNFLSEKRSNFLENGSPDWSDIKGLYFFANATGEIVAAVDYWRLEKADPDDADNPNATGAAWDFQPTGGAWTITKDGPDGSNYAVLACLDKESGVEKIAMRDASLQPNVRGFCKVASLDDAGRIGIAFRINDINGSSEDCYVFALDLTSDDAYLYRYLAGTPSTLAGPIDTGDTLTSDTWYWLGFDLNGQNYDLYYSSTEPSGTTNLEKQNNLLSAGNLLVSATSTTFLTGDIGFFSYGTLGRFDNLYVESSEDRHVPADQVTVEAAALFRTTYPFTD